MRCAQWILAANAISVQYKNGEPPTGMENKKWEGGGLNFEYDNFWAAVGINNSGFFMRFSGRRGTKKDLKFSLEVNLWHFSHQ